VRRNDLKRTVIVAMRPVWVMQVAIDQIVDMVAVRHGLVAAPGTMAMTDLVPGAAMAGRAASGVACIDGDLVLVDMAVVWVMKVAVVQIVDVTVVPDGDMAAARPMGMRMIVMNALAVVGHFGISFVVAVSMPFAGVGNGVVDQCQDVLVSDAVEYGAALAPPGDQTRRVQHLETRRDGRHRLAPQGRDLRNASFLSHHQHQDPEARPIRQGTEHARDGVELRGNELSHHGLPFTF